MKNGDFQTNQQSVMVPGLGVTPMWPSPIHADVIVTLQQEFCRGPELMCLGLSELTMGQPYIIDIL